MFHHELFHLVDWKDDGVLYGDVEWAKLKPSSFRYGDGGVNMQNDSSLSLVTDKFPGFVTRYSTAGVEEDKLRDPEVAIGMTLGNSFGPLVVREGRRSGTGTGSSQIDPSAARQKFRYG